MKQWTVSGVFEVTAAPENGVSSFKQTVFIRQGSAPSAPTGGSYADPYPDEDGWEDGVPDGTDVLWASSRIFSSDGNAPQQDAWTAPRAMADTSSFRVRYSSKNPPSGNPDDAPSEWTTAGGDDTMYIATQAKEDGVWGEWAVTKIVGEDAEYYSVSVGASTIKRTATGYVPYLLPVRKFLVRGSSQTATGTHYVLVFGLKGEEAEHITTIADGTANFNASAYFQDDYDGFKFCLRTSEASSVDIAPAVTVMVTRDGENGENAKYYTLEVGASGLKRGESAYIPSSFKVGEYLVDGSAKSAVSDHYIVVYGVSGTEKVKLITLQGETTFYTGSYFSADYDAFMFCLRESSDSGVDIAPAVTVSVSRDGEKGYTGARMRMREWVSGETYLSGADGEEWYDVVEYGDLLYLCLTSHSGRTYTPQSDVANSRGYWEAAQQWTFIATKLLLAERIKSDMIDTNDLVAKRIYTDVQTATDPDTGETVTNNAHIELAGSEMKVFGKYCMNIRFGVNEEGYAVLEYYDNEGNFLYDLGPNGLSTSEVREERWVAGYWRKLGDTISEVLSDKNYKVMKVYSEEYKVYRYVSRINAGVNQDETNDNLWFVTKNKSGSKIEDGYYQMMPSSDLMNYVYAQWAATDTGEVLTSSVLNGLSTYNEKVYDRVPVYCEIIYKAEGGRITESGVIAYWNSSVV